MRPLLWAGLALVLVAAAALWWVVDARATRGELPQPSGVSGIDEEAEPLLAAPEVAVEPDAPASDAAPNDGAPATSREALDAAARPIRGRLLDAHCERPIEGGVVLELSSRASGVKERVEVGPGGAFATERAFAPKRVAVRILEARSGDLLLQHALVLDPREPVWTMRAELGLVVPLELSIPDGIPAERVMARVVEYGSEGPHEWIWMPVLGGEHPFVRYFALRQRIGSAAARIEVDVEPERGPGAHGEAPLVLTHGLHAPVHVELFEDTNAFGRVLDGRGEGVVGARVTLLPTAAEAPLTSGALGRRSVRTGKDGEFSLEELEPGPHVLYASSGTRALVPRRFVLQHGANDLGSTVIGRIGGWTVEGRIVDWPSGDDWFLFVELVEPESGRRWYTRTTAPPDEEPGRAFAFHDVAPGTYEVRPVYYYPGARFEPPSATVSPSSPAVEFRRVEPTAQKLVLRALDESSRVAIDRLSVACRGDLGWVGGDLSPDESLPFPAERYAVRAEGYRALVIDSAAFTPSEGEVRRADVLLQRGWSRLLAFVEADPSATWDDRLELGVAAPLSGVRVLAGGREVATSDAEGLAVVSLAQDPGHLTFELAGHHVLATESDSGLLYVTMIRTE